MTSTDLVARLRGWADGEVQLSARERLIAISEAVARLEALEADRRSKAERIEKLEGALRVMRQAAKKVMEEALSIPLGRDHLIAIGSMQNADDKARSALERP